MAGFFRKLFGRDKPEPRRIYFKPRQVPTLVRLADAYDKARTKTTRYQLWKYIERYIPEVAHGTWNLSLENITHPSVLEVI